MRQGKEKYHIAKKRYSGLSTSTTRSNLQVASKAYKKKMNFYITKYNKSMQKKLQSVKTKSPKDNWKILNNVDQKKHKNENINLDSLYAFFSKV